MAKSVRRNAGLGDPPLPYYTNDLESCNAIIKRAVQFKEKEISEFVRQMSVLLQQQKNDVESAIFNKGPFTLAKDFKKFYDSETQWFKKRNEQRDQHMQNFHRAKMTNEIGNEGSATVATPRETTSNRTLSLDLLNANIVSFPVVALQAIVKKSEELLNRHGAIIPAPGRSNAYMVESQTSTKPHFVDLKKNGKVVCDGCPSYTSAKLCAHAIAASEKAGTLESYVKWLIKYGPSSINLTSFVTYDSSTNTGKKNPKSSTTKRKGGRNKKVQPVITTVDRPFYERSSAQNLIPSSQPSSQPPSQPPNQPPSQPPSKPPSQQRSQPPRQLPSQPTSQSTVYLPQPIPQSAPPLVQLSEALRIQFAQRAPQQITQGRYLANQPQHHVPTDVSRIRPPAITSFFPQPGNGSLQLHFLQYCPPAVRVCFGCFQTLKPDNRVPDPPYDLTIVSRMPRAFTHPTSGEKVNKEGNVYFHVRLECIRAKQPIFIPTNVTVATWVAQQLTMEHIFLLREFGMHI